MSLKSTNAKELFRKSSLAKLEFAASEKRMRNSKAVVFGVKQILKSINFKTIALYLPLENEVDIRGLLNDLRKEKQVYVPFMECVSFKLVKYRLPMRKKKFNIMEPQNSLRRAPKIDVAVVPVVGVDGDMRRVGFGKGMYDRFFASLRGAPLIIFVQLTECFTEDRLCEPFDVQADIYITPTNTMIKRGKNVFGIRNRGSRRGSYRGRGICSGEKTGLSKP